MSVEHELGAALEPLLGGIIARSVARYAVMRSGTNPAVSASSADAGRLLLELEKAISLYASSTEIAGKCLERSKSVIKGGAGVSAAASIVAVSIPIRQEPDIVRARGIGRDLSGRLGFSPSSQIKYVGEGEIDLDQGTLDDKVCLDIRARDQGPGIGQLDAILSGGYRSRSGLGMGLLGSKRLSDVFEIQSEAGQGTNVFIKVVLR